MQLNVGHFVKTYGAENCGMFTVTFAEDLSPQEAQKRVHNFRRRELSSMFQEWIRVREFTKRGRVHYHFVVACEGDIRTGFDWEHYDRITKWSKEGRKGPKPAGRLNQTALLKSLWDRLNAKGPLYGIGRMELTPVRSEAGIGYYVGGYLSKSQDNRPESAKGTRGVTYSQGYSRVCKGAFSWVSPPSWVWRAKLKQWAGYHGCFTMKDVAALFGPRWAYHHRDAIMAVKLRYYPTGAEARADGHCVPVDCTDVTINGGSVEHPKWEVPDSDPLPSPAGRKYVLRPISEHLPEAWSRRLDAHAGQPHEYLLNLRQ